MPIDKEYDLKQDIKDTVKSWFSIILNDLQVDEFLKYWADRFEEDMYAFDTLERGDFADYIGNKFVGRDWPTFGEGLDDKDFILPLYKKLTDSEFELEKIDED